MRQSPRLYGERTSSDYKYIRQHALTAHAKPATSCPSACGNNDQLSKSLSGTPVSLRGPAWQRFVAPITCICEHALPVTCDVSNELSARSDFTMSIVDVYKCVNELGSF